MNDKSKDEALKRMYNALMAIGCVDSELLGYKGGFDRVQQIANACMKEMNVEYTGIIQRAIGIGR